MFVVTVTFVAKPGGGGAALEAHRKTPHYLPFSAASAALVADKRVATYRLADPPP